MNRIDWLRVVVWTPLLLLGAALLCGALVFIGYVGPRLLSAALQYAQAHPWVPVLAVLAMVVWVAKAASKDNPSW